jgi:rhodanese-related sulfurtransferase
MMTNSSGLGPVMGIVKRRVVGGWLALLVWVWSSGGYGWAESISGSAVTRLADVAAVERVLAGERPVVLDVRTAREFAGGRLAGAKNVDYTASGFEAKVGELDREQTYLVYCQTGRRSVGAVEVMRRLGFKSVVHFDKGYSAWARAGKPVEKPKG